MRDILNDYFYSDNIDFAPAKVKFRRKDKYKKKLLARIAMSPRGISEPFIVESGNSADQFVYRDSPKTASFYQKNIILMEITYFGRIKQAVTTLDIHWTFYARI